MHVHIAKVSNAGAKGKCIYVNAKIVIRTVFVKAIDRLLNGTKIVAAYG